jgi:hypothetical protein
MRAWLIPGVVCLGAAGPASAQRGRDPQHPRWFADYELARAEAKASNRPMFLVFRCVP